MRTSHWFARNGSWRPGGLLLGLAALLPLVALAGFALFTALGAYRTADELRLRNTAQALAAAVDAQLGSVAAALQTLSSSSQLDGEFDAQGFAARSRAVGELFDGWVVLLGPPPNYRVLSLSSQADQASLPPRLPPENRHAIDPLLTEVFRYGRAGISDLFEGSVIRRQILTAMVPVIRDGQVTHALALSFDPASLRALLARQDLPPGTFAAVADGQLRILAHSFDPEGRGVGARAPDWVNAALDGKQRTLLVGPGWSGQDNVYAVERLKLAPNWTVTVAEPLAAQQTSAWAALRWLLAGGAALGLGLSAIVWADRREALRDARREAEALRAGRAEVERLHGGLPAIIFLREVRPDLSSRLIYRGGDIETVSGWPAATFAGRDGFEGFADLEKPEYRAFLARVLRDGKATIEYRMRQPDGSWRPWRSRCRLLRRRPDGTGEIVGYILDVSAERAAEARALAAARLASLGEMAAGLAHEMRQPLQGISLAAEVAQLAARRGDAATVDERLEDIVEQTRRTSDMIEHLRRFARGADEGTPEDAVPLAPVVQGALEMMRSALRDASIAVEVSLGDPAPVICGQALLLEQVLSNLLLNARDALAARPGDAPRRIMVAAEPGPDGTVRLSIADNGGGIPPDLMPRLFEPFFTTKGPDRGTGLGLSICYGLVKGMGGSIEARNGTEGAVFTLTLRAAPLGGNGRHEA